MLERRSLLRGLAALPLAGVPTAASATPGGNDPIPALLAEKRRVIDLINGHHYATEGEIDALMDRWGACDAQVIANPATTLAGAAASLDWARDELLEFGFPAAITPDDKGVRLIIALLDGALGVLRQSGGVS